MTNNKVLSAEEIEIVLLDKMHPADEYDIIGEIELEDVNGQTVSVRELADEINPFKNSSGSHERAFEIKPEEGMLDNSVGTLKETAARLEDLKVSRVKPLELKVEEENGEEDED